jgi:hypothetical protein
MVGGRGGNYKDFAPTTELLIALLHQRLGKPGVLQRTARLS